jgi:hypothetical protein
LIVLPSAPITIHIQQIIELAGRNRLAAVYMQHKVALLLMAWT